MGKTRKVISISTKEHTRLKRGGLTVSKITESSSVPPTIININIYKEDNYGNDEWKLHLTQEQFDDLFSLFKEIDKEVTT